MRTGRLIGFFISILLGIIGGGAYGWLYHPLQTTNTSLASLRADFKADYVLMVAESYHNNGDLDNAISLLNSINTGDALNAVQRGLLTAQGMEYEEGDMRLIADLEAALLHNSPGGAR